MQKNYETYQYKKTSILCKIYEIRIDKGIMCNILGFFNGFLILLGISFPNLK